MASMMNSFLYFFFVQNQNYFLGIITTKNQNYFLFWMGLGGDVDRETAPPTTGSISDFGYISKGRGS